MMIAVEYIEMRTVPQWFQEWTEEEMEKYYRIFSSEEEKKDAMKGEDQ